MLRKPLHIDDDEMCLRNSDGEDVADVFLHGEAVQIVREVNAFDALLAACEAMLDGLDDYWLASDHGQGVFKMAKAAIAKAKPEPASRPDVSC